MIKSRPKFAIVYWNDSAIYRAESTFSADEKVDTAPMISIGFVMADNKKFIALAKEYHGESHECWRTVSTYPKDCVIKIEYHKGIK